ncbi:vWA domain-containing protein [Leptothoe kymatousa]|uniref:VWFA domain-containing protein n=1 Tax=Leptothoe kymatousa TAU-MAC 1615 TaxID=2364775 RepID=A0ABS5Y6Y7_9CYAN|nr:hypothetical protein [Leptothoe kymatousa]MBT9313583.1 hypothetical protein [Leptothoe kymatousa TAU-MAC 1615]
MADLPNSPLARLSNRNYTLIYAPTQPQRVAMPPGFEHRWQRAHAHLLRVAEQCYALATHGLTVYRQSAADGDFQAHQNVNVANFESLMANAPMASQVELTPVLTTVLEQYFAAKARAQLPANGEIVLVLLDSEPTDRLAIAKQIVAASQKLDHNDELGIGWVQVGDDFITKGFLVTLDDNLREKGAKFDIVDHKTIDQIIATDLVSFLTGVLND